MKSKNHERASESLTATTLTTSRPEAERVATPSPNFDGALSVGVNVAGGGSSRAGCPVHRVNLPDSDVIRSIGVVVSSIGISAGFVVDNALATSLVPSREFSTLSSNINIAGAGSARARATVIRRAVSSASVKGGGYIAAEHSRHNKEDSQEKEGRGVHG